MPTDTVFNGMADSEETGLGLFRLTIGALAAGGVTGVLGALFRMALEQGESARNLLLRAAHQYPGWGWLIPVIVITLCVTLARYLIRFQPLASGSGVQLVEAMMRGEVPLKTPWVVPVKFIGGVLALGSGLVLGREGPTVQMGSSVGLTLARWFRLTPSEMRMLQGAAAGAGLAVAFNAPLGGAIFVFEELARRFMVRLTIITLAACGTAIAVSRLLIGNHAVYPVFGITHPPFWSAAPHLFFGLILGAIGVAYNRTIITFIDLFNRFTAVPVLLRTAGVGTVIGLTAWFFPEIVGGGEPLNGNILQGGFSFSVIAMVLAGRWLLGPLSYAPGTPGGLFAPMLVIGSLLGLFYGTVLDSWFPGVGLQPTAFAIVGMAAFFAAVVRAPLTGIALVIEMTADTTLLVPLLVASSGAVIASVALGGKSIYGILRVRMLRAADKSKREASQAEEAPEMKAHAKI